MKILFAEIRNNDGSLVESGDVYITILKVTDITHPTTTISRTKSGVYYAGYGIWAYNNPYENPGSEIYIGIFDYTEIIDNEEFSHVVTGIISTEDDNNWSIIGAGASIIGEIKTKNSGELSINMNDGRKLRLRKH
jgi:hypothetical protein